jgi:hypothetical protein
MIDKCVNNHTLIYFFLTISSRALRRLSASVDIHSVSEEGKTNVRFLWDASGEGK